MKWNDETELVLVEMVADYHGWIASEEELSEKFDEEIMPAILEAHGERGVAFTDHTMIAEEFNNWCDALCEEGEIHKLQNNAYCYVGKWIKWVSG